MRFWNFTKANQNGIQNFTQIIFWNCTDWSLFSRETVTISGAAAELSDNGHQKQCGRGFNSLGSVAAPPLTRCDLECSIIFVFPLPSFIWWYNNSIYKAEKILEPCVVPTKCYYSEFTELLATLHLLPFNYNSASHIS